MQMKVTLVPITEQSEKPLRGKHAGFDTLSEEMDVQYREVLLDQPLELEGVIDLRTRKTRIDCYLILKQELEWWRIGPGSTHQPQL
jgi:hypothetical protein